MSISKPGNGYILQASSATASSGGSPPVNVFTDQLVVTGGPPSNVSAGSSYPVVVVAEDGNGNLDSSFNGQVTVTVTDPSDDSQVTTVTLNALNGKASGVVTFAQSGDFILDATSDGVAETSYPVDVAPVSVTGVDPTFGPLAGGTAVTITGLDFTDVAQVDFGIVPATSFTVNSPTSITATSPAGTVGTVDVTVTTADGTSATSQADQFTYAYIVSNTSGNANVENSLPWAVAQASAAAGDAIVDFNISANQANLILGWRSDGQHF